MSRPRSGVSRQDGDPTNRPQHNVRNRPRASWAAPYLAVAMPAATTMTGICLLLTISSGSAADLGWHLIYVGVLMAMAMQLQTETAHGNRQDLRSP